MSTSTRVSFARYEEMVRRGAFEPREEHRVELIHGEVLPTGPIGPPHNHAVMKLTDWCIDVLPRDAAWLSVQGPIGIPALDSEPEPDVLWVRREDYSTRHPNPADVLLVIEVSDSSLDKDRHVKARLYAEAGILDYWLVNLPEECVEVRRNPKAGVYQSLEVFQPGQEVRPLAFPDVVLPVARIFPEREEGANS